MVKVNFDKEKVFESKILMDSLLKKYGYGFLEIDVSSWYDRVWKVKNILTKEIVFEAFDSGSIFINDSGELFFSFDIYGDKARKFEGRQLKSTCVNDETIEELKAENEMLKRKIAEYEKFRDAVCAVKEFLCL